MLHKVMVSLFMFPVTLLLVLVNLWVLTTYSESPSITYPLNANASTEGNFHLAAATGTSQVLSATIEAGDSRALLVESFLRRHNSPMAPFAGIIVEEADRFNIDYRLVPAIAMCESNAGKRMPKKDEYNAYGIAVYTGQVHGKAFTSWQHSIAWVSQYIKERYHDMGLKDLKDMGAKWAPPSVNTGHSWSKCVQSFSDEII